MSELTALHALASALGVHTRYTDGLCRKVEVGADTLMRTCTAIGVPITRPADAAAALREWQARHANVVVAPVAVAWDGVLPPLAVHRDATDAHLTREDGSSANAHFRDGTISFGERLEPGYHTLVVGAGARTAECTIISAPMRAHRRGGRERRWGVGVHLAALRSGRSRSFGDLRDLETLADWIHHRGGDVVTLLPLLPTFNTDDPEPSPYSPVSRLFWSELILDLGDGHHPTAAPRTLDVTAAHAEVWRALQHLPMPDANQVDPELARYARFRGAQARLGRNWRAWPAEAKEGSIGDEEVDPDVERFHLVAQLMLRQQLGGLRDRLDQRDFALGLDLAVGVHPDGYDVWSRQHLFAGGVSVGAPPDAGFPSGQDWGFSPVLPDVSRAEGHRYVGASIAHQMALAGVLRVDHIMAWTRLYWIPHGLGLHEGTYVSYPAEELFAALTLESARHRCEVVGENLGTVPPEISTALPRHAIRGMYLAQFEAALDLPIVGPTSNDVALVGTHDTPTFAGWIGGDDVGHRLRHRLLEQRLETAVRSSRAHAATRLAAALGSSVDNPVTLFEALLQWLGRSESPLVVAWIEDLWLEVRGVNLPGTRSSVHPNWQRPMSRLLDDILSDPAVDRCLRMLDAARQSAPIAQRIPPNPNPGIP